MRKTALMLIMLTLMGLSANVMVQEVHSQDSGQGIEAIISDSEIVIDDMTYRINPDCDFYAADGKTLVNFTYFQEGDQVTLDFEGRLDLVERVAALPIEVFAHNLKDLLLAAPAAWMAPGTARRQPSRASSPRNSW